MLEALARISDDEGALTRTFLSPGLRRAKLQVSAWMKDAGLDVYEDAAGNLIGRREGKSPRVLACGSHLDTVRNAGRFDGALGIVAALSAVRDLPLLKHTIEVVAFSDEEGVRFQTPYLGSRFYAGDAAVLELDLADADGISLRAALATHKPEFPAPPPRILAAYVEAHIEQGPVLESLALPLGVVTAIAGQSRLRVRFEGKSGHAGTTPMEMRRDALAAAAEAIGVIEHRARAGFVSVATVGRLDIPNAASNVIPGEVVFTIDIRDASDARREAFVGEITCILGDIATRRSLALGLETFLSEPAVPCDPSITRVLAESIASSQPECPELVSGAGHDAVPLAKAAPVGMFFVRSRDGLSHHPDEFSAPADVEAAVRVLHNFLLRFSP